MPRLAGVSSIAKKVQDSRRARLRVNGVDFRGWKAVRVTRTIEALSGSFDFAATDRPNADRKAWYGVMPEDRCQVLLGDEVVLTGYVDRRSVSYSKDEHSIGLAGRDAAASLVDCSARPGEFWGVKLLDFARRLAEPFGVRVEIQAPLSPVVPGRFTIDAGESAWNALERACRAAGILSVSDGQGGILLTSTGTSRCKTELVEGKNILSASTESDATGLYRDYEVIAQHPGTDDFCGDATASVRGSAKDPNVQRAERLLIVHAESAMTPELAKRRAEWEAIVRAARGTVATVRVQGWTQGPAGDGALWPVNALVHLRSPMLGVDGDVLISQATYTLDSSGGTTTELSLKRRDAFTPEPQVPHDGAWAELRGGVK